MKIAALDYIIDRYKIDVTGKLPVEIPNVGRDNLAQWLHDLDFKIGVEVGVAAGEYSQSLCQANPQMKIYGVDVWKPYRGYTDYTRKETLSKLYGEAMDRLSKYHNYNFIQEFSLEAAKRFTDNSIDFVYVDANHREPYITQDITEWSKKVKRGGIVAGHDYNITHVPHIDVEKAVREYVKQHQIRPWFVLGSRVKKGGAVRDSVRSWLWIKP